MTSEAEFQRRVLGHAKAAGWKVYHGRQGRPGWALGSGFPDLVLVRNRVVYVELKAEGGKVHPRQKEWMDLLHEAGQEVYVWKPSDWAEVERVLR